MATSRPLPKANMIARPLVSCTVALASAGGVSSAGPSARTRVDSWKDKFRLEHSQLWIDTMSGTCEPTIRPGGETLDGMEAGFIEVTLGTTEPERQRAPVHTTCLLRAADRTEPACPEIEGS